MAFKNPQDQVKFMHDWYLRNKPQVRQAGRAWRSANPEKQLALSAKRRAKKFKVPFTITWRDIIIPKKCPVLGITLKIGAGDLCDASPSLDRIVPHLGYVPGNIAVMSNKANSIKRNATSQEIHQVADWLKRQENRSKT
jgi:hypothetical protein